MGAPTQNRALGRRSLGQRFVKAASRGVPGGASELTGSYSVYTESSSSCWTRRPLQICTCSGLAIAGQVKPSSAEWESLQARRCWSQLLGARLRCSLLCWGRKRVCRHMSAVVKGKQGGSAVQKKTQDFAALQSR